MFRNQPSKPTRDDWPDYELVRVIILFLLRDCHKSWREVRQIGLRLIASTPKKNPPESTS
jgi:hypothetical protein